MNQPDSFNTNQKKKARILTREEADAERMNMPKEERILNLIRRIRLLKTLRASRNQNQ